MGSVPGDPRDGGRRTHQGYDLFPGDNPVLLGDRPFEIRNVRTGGRQGHTADVVFDDGSRHTFMHLPEMPQPGRYGPGQWLGAAGNTGNARTTPPHIHYEGLDAQGNPIDPRTYFAGSMSAPAAPGAAAIPPPPPGFEVEEPIVLGAPRPEAQREVDRAMSEAAGAPNMTTHAGVFADNPTRRSHTNEGRFNGAVPEGMVASFPADAEARILNYLPHARTYDDVEAYASQTMRELYGFGEDGTQPYSFVDSSARPIIERALETIRANRGRPPHEWRGQLPRIGPMTRDRYGNELNGQPLRSLAEWEAIREANRSDPATVGPVDYRFGEMFSETMGRLGERIVGRGYGQRLRRDFDTTFTHVPIISAPRWIEDGVRSVGIGARRGEPGTALGGAFMIALGGADLFIPGGASLGRRIGQETLEAGLRRAGDAELVMRAVRGRLTTMTPRELDNPATLRAVFDEEVARAALIAGRREAADQAARATDPIARAPGQSTRSALASGSANLPPPAAGGRLQDFAASADEAPPLLSSDADEFIPWRGHPLHTQYRQLEERWNRQAGRLSPDDEAEMLADLDAARTELTAMVRGEGSYAARAADEPTLAAPDAAPASAFDVPPGAAPASAASSDIPPPPAGFRIIDEEGQATSPEPTWDPYGPASPVGRALDAMAAGRARHGIDPAAFPELGNALDALAAGRLGRVVDRIDIPRPNALNGALDDPSLGRVPRLGPQPTPQELVAAMRGLRPADVRPLASSAVDSPNALTGSIAPVAAPPALGRRPAQPETFTDHLRTMLAEESRRAGVRVRIDAEAAIDAGVPAELIYKNPNVADRSLLRLRNPRIFGTRYGKMRRNEQVLRSLDLDNIDPIAWGFEGRVAAGRLEPEEVGDLLRRSLENDPSALRRGAAFDDWAAYESRAANRAEFEGRYPDGPPVERLGRPANFDDLDDMAPPVTAYEELPALTGRIGNINLANIETRGDVRRLLRNVEERFGGFDAARRGRISHGETAALADEMGMTVDDLLSRKVGQALNAEQMLAARTILAKSLDEVTAAAAKLGDNPSDEELAQFWKMSLRHAAIHEQVSGATAEAGRALSQFRKAASSHAISGRLHEAIVQAGGGRAHIEDVARRILDLRARGVGPGDVTRFAVAATRPKTADKLVELWYNSILSGPQTHIVNMLSNAGTAVLQIPEHLVASGFGQVRRGVAKLRGREDDFDRVLLSEVGARSVGLMQGSADGIRAFARTLRTGEVSDFVTKVEARSQHAISGVKGSVIRTPSRFLAAEDELFKAVGRRMELNGLAVRQARREGLHGDALRARIADLARNPTPEMVEKSLSYARYITFQTPLGRVGQRISATTQEHPWLKLFLPFVRTPTNLIKFAAERSPLAPLLKGWRADVAAGGARRDLALTRAAMGTGFGSLVYWLARQGVITGGGPADRRARDMMIADGWQPYSIRLGDTYYSYARFDPLATTLGIAADMENFGEQMTERQQQQSAALLVASVIRNLGNKTWLSGAGDLLGAFDDPQRNLQSMVARLAGSIAVPSIVNQAAQYMDPIERDTRGDGLVEAVRDRIMSRIPGLSDNLAPRRDVLGREMRREGALGPDAFSPIRMREAQNDPITRELLEADARIGRPSRRVAGRRLSSEEFSSYQELSGRYIREDLQEIVGSPDWEGATIEERREMVDGIKRDARADARADLALDQGEEGGGNIPPPPPGFTVTPPPAGFTLER